jgi:hypothetical protein
LRLAKLGVGQRRSKDSSPGLLLLVGLLLLRAHFLLHKTKLLKGYKAIEELLKDCFVPEYSTVR